MRRAHRAPKARSWGGSLHALPMSIVLAGCLAGCGRNDAQPPPRGNPPPPDQSPLNASCAGAAPMPLADTRFFAYQIQNIEDDTKFAALVNSRYDLFIIEPTRTINDQGNFDIRSRVQQLKSTCARDGVHRRRVIAYVDIGEAEDYRWYWTWSRGWPTGTPRPKDWPDYIVIADPDGWDGSYPVAFWDPRWQDIVVNGTSTTPGGFGSIVDEAVRDGFDGIYLDWVQAFAEPAVVAAAQKASIDPAAKMIELIAKIRSTARARNPDFVVVQQNATDLADGHPELFPLIDGLGQEDVWYAGTGGASWDAANGHDIQTDPADTAALVESLNDFKSHGIPIFTTNYAVTHATETYTKAAGLGYANYATRVALSQLSTTPPPGY